MRRYFKKVFVFIALMFVMTSSGAAFAEWIRPADYGEFLKPGIVMTFREYMDGEDAGQTFEIEPKAFWSKSLRYEHRTFGADGELSTRGMSTILDRENCVSLNCWWYPGNQISSTSCEMWVSRRVYEMVEMGRRADFIIDIEMRRDDDGVVWLERRDFWMCEFNGRWVALPVLVLRSSLGDTLWVLDNPNNPLVVKFESKIAGWELLKVATQNHNP